jgi:hypothetical protein
MTPVLRRDAATVTSGRPTRFANRIKYRDQGKKHGRGRAGISSLEARALLGRDGVTSLEISTGVIDGAPGAGVLSKIQLKQFAPNGALQITTNYNGINSAVYQLALPGRVRGSTLGVQGNVSEIGYNRTDVVALDETVKLRPDLSVDRIISPTQSVVAVPVEISALISENNADVGARADCLLAVDGVEVDRARGIWVDAGRSVSCLFTHVFPTVGTKQLTVSAVSVSPGDWSAANNSVTQTIAIVLPANEFTWTATYVAVTNWTGTSFSQGYWTRPSVGDRSEWSFNQVVHRSDSWTAHAGGNVGAMAGPLTFSFQDEIDGKLLNRVQSGELIENSFSLEGSYEDPDVGTVNYRTACTRSYSLVPAVFEGQEIFVSPANFTICTWLRSGPSGPLPHQSFTDFNYSTSAGDVSFYGESYQNYDDGTPETTYDNTFSFNGETAYAYGTLAFGRDYSFRLTISGSEESRTAYGTIHLPPPTEVVVSQPFGCQEQNDPDFFSSYCSSGDYRQSYTSGIASGTPGQ